MQGRIGLMDSGLGGLTVLRQVLERHPHQPFLYLGDTARVPYGQRSATEIRTIARELIGWFRSQRVDLVVMACNTTNALAFDVFEAEAGVPVLGLIDSVAAQLRADRVGVLATPATAASGAYGHALRAGHPGTLVVEVGCPAFVPLIEAGKLDDDRLRQAALLYLEPLLIARVQTIVLGCTHYPLLQDLLLELLPAGVSLVDPAVATVERLGSLLQQTPAAPVTSCGLEQPRSLASNGRFCVTGDPRSFAEAATPWLGWQPAVEQVNLHGAGRSS
ncbi:glutamate racemase [Synechococcus sp. CS-1324]|uniref:glutamate racemase n=1 Tax=unclassified Synechococcus TaxID=2626047 RepID=UPI000DAFB0EA|nr:MULTISPECIES: glutamate racemase [unclassified Synechococcus]MCT0213995.1 glutamate racemase [Synechococcus sp. CS-1326]MCT0230061.1 glutamate racemase [Synechococcus sp. CS-1324]MCT0233571.1 glutamate racemase [Synechococcus sp. CS-1327]PZV03793.1 MAG: glutamate racemase [Cyanobium sp.]